MGVELRVRAKEFCAAGAATVGSRLLGVDVVTGPGRLRARLAQDGVLRGGKTGLPLGIRASNGVGHPVRALWLYSRHGDSVGAPPNRRTGDGRPAQDRKAER